jgi:hypothetical protein
MNKLRHKEITLDQLRIKCRHQHLILSALNKELRAVKEMRLKHAINCQVIAAEKRLKGTQEKIRVAEKEIKSLNRSHNQKPYLRKVT